MDRAHADVEALLAQSDWVARLAGALARDPITAEDLRQDAWAVALERAPRGADPAGLRRWLAAVVKNLARRRRRAEATRDFHERRAAHGEHGLDPAQLEERLQLQRTLAEAVLGLSEPYRSAVALRWLQGCTPAEVAARQGVSYAAACQRLHRGIELLRERMDREHPGGRSEWLGAIALAFPADARLAAGAGIGALALSAKTWIAAAGVVAAAGLALWFGTHRAGASSRPPDGGSSLVTTALAQQADSVQGERATGADGPSRAPVARAADAAAAAAEREIDRERDLFGVVLDPSGAPVAGASVLVTHEPTSGFIALSRRGAVREVGRAATDARGEFAFRLEPGQMYSVDVEAAGYAYVQMDNRAAGERLDVRLARGGSVSGALTNGADGSRLGGCDVFLSPLELYGGLMANGRTRSTRADAEGRYRFDGVAQGAYFIGLLSPSLPAQDWLRIVVGSCEEVVFDVVAKAGALVRGTVRDARTGLAIAGASISEGESKSGGATTDSAGRYEIMKSRAVYAALRASASGYGWQEVRAWPEGRGSVAETVDFELLPELRVRGRVVGSDGAPIEGARVGAAGEDDRPPFGSRLDWRLTSTDAEGRFEIAGLLCDLDHALIVQANGHAFAQLAFPEASVDRTEVDFGDVVLREGGSVRGVVQDAAGRPVTDIQVMLDDGEYQRRKVRGGKEWGLADAWFGQRVSRTDDLGRFAFVDVGPGDYTAEAKLPMHSLGRTESFRVGPSQRLEGIVIRIDGDLGLKGIVVDAQGKGVHDAWIRTQVLATGKSGGLVRSRPDGRFEMRGFGPGRIRLDVGPKRFENGGTTAWLAGATAEVTLPTEDELRLVMRPGAPIRGRVLGPGGDPLEGAQIVAIDAGGAIIASDGSDERGAFELIVPEGETWTVEARPLADMSIDVPLEELAPARAANVLPGQDELELQITRAR